MPSLALITGATGGIGTAVATRLFQEGSSLILLGKTQRKLEVLHNALYPMKQKGQGLSTIAVNMQHPVNWWRIETLLEAYSRQGYLLDLVVVCHGTSPTPGPALNALQDMRTVMEIDVYGAFQACQAGIAEMTKRHHGSIVLISSLHARQTYPERTAYATAKAALCGMARALAVEYGPMGLRTNIILPWQVEGARTQAFLEAAMARGENLAEAYLQRCPARQLVTTDDIANTVMWLASSPGVNGAEIVLDGGVSASMWHKPFLEQENKQGEPSHVVPALSYS